MGHWSCCVANCKNNGRNKNFKFYRFPSGQYKIEQSRKWIAAVRKVNLNYITDGTLWFPKSCDRICSAHFIGNTSSNIISSPSYIPTIFNPSCDSTDRQTAKLERFQRFMKRRTQKQICLLQKNKQINQEVCGLDIDDEMDYEEAPCNVSNERFQVDQACQVNFLIEDEVSKTFTCNRYIVRGATQCDAEVQTEIVEHNSIIKIPNRKRYKDAECNTPQKVLVDQASGPNFERAEDAKEKYFCGFDSIKTDRQLLNLAGITFENFKLLLKIIDEKVSEKCIVPKTNRLLIFLFKMKTGLTFAAISIIFTIHATTVSRIFFSLLEILSRSTTDFVFWPDRDVVQSTMPECFRPEYSNTRVIIDCTEFKIEAPAAVDNRVYTYSHYKKGFTAKLLVGITPSGFISFKSRVAGGRKSDSQITIESGLIDLLEDGDIILADKGFPDIRKTIDGSGKQVLLVMPPFLEKKTEFTEEQTKETYGVARVRIHVERIMQRLRIYLILDKIPEHLFSHVDDIVHVCCVLVNLQPSIMSENSTSKDDGQEND